MRRGVLLPTFRTSPRDAMDAADEAEAAGIDGVFAYDHVWPMGSPDRPAIAPFEVLATVARRNRTLTVGTLVARVGLVAAPILLAQCRALRLVAEGRVIIGIGTGDQLSRAENLAYGIAYDPADARRAALSEVASTLHAEGVEVWIGGGAAATRAVAVEVGCTLNLWGATPAEVRVAAQAGPVTWAGPAPSVGDESDEMATETLLVDLATAGAGWSVLAPSSHVAAIARLGEDIQPKG